MLVTFVKAWKIAGRYDAADPFGLWLYSIARGSAAYFALATKSLVSDCRAEPTTTPSGVAPARWA